MQFDDPFCMVVVEHLSVMFEEFNTFHRGDKGGFVSLESGQGESILQPSHFVLPFPVSTFLSSPPPSPIPSF